MFRLVVLLFSVASGAPESKPSLVIELKPGFESREACMDFLRTEEGSKAKTAIEGAADEIEGNVLIKPVCIKGEDKEDDGRI